MATALVTSVRVVKRRGLGGCDVRLLTVKCPYGPHEHTHGGGDASRSIVLGWRSPHCRVGRDYVLLLAPDLASAEAARA